MTYFVFSLCLFLCSCSLFSQVRVAVLPLRNMDLKVENNKYCYSIPDSLRVMLSLDEQSGKSFYVIPLDSIELVLSELNLDPTNPQYESDLWKSVQKLNAAIVISGNFNISGEKLLLNMYAYNAKTKMPDPTNQAKNIYKSKDNILSAIEMIKNRLLPALK